MRTHALYLLQQHGLQNGYHYIDVNIGKNRNQEVERVRALLSLRVAEVNKVYLSLCVAPGVYVALSTNKDHAKAVVAEAGVKVVHVIILHCNDNIEEIASKVTYPVVTNPWEENKPIGVTLVHTKENFRNAIAKAFQFDNTILIEQYIPLRHEFRIGMIGKDNGTFDMVPVMEHFVTVLMIN